MPGQQLERFASFTVCVLKMKQHPKMRMVLLMLLTNRTGARSHDPAAVRHAGGCTVRPGDDIQGAIARAAAVGQRRCDLTAGEYVVHRPIELPSGFVLVGAGPGHTVVRSAIVPPDPSVADWPRYSLASQHVGPQPLLSVFFSENTTGIRLSAMAVDGGLSASQRSFSNTACGEGTGSDAVFPGFAGCRFLQFGLLLQSVTGASVDNVVITNATRGVYVRGGAGIVLRDSVFAGNGFGSQTSDTISGCTNVSLTNCSFRDSLGHGLSVEDTADLNLRDLRTTNNAWHGVRLANSTDVALVNLAASGNGKCGIELLNLQSFRVFGGTITHNACTGQGGICIAGSTRDGNIGSLAVVGNGGNLVGSGAQNLSLADILCDMVLYKNKAWALECAGCHVSNVSCHGNMTQAPVQPAQVQSDEDRVSTGSGRVGGVEKDRQECLIKPGDAIQPQIDELVSRAGGGKCLLAAGVHEISVPIVVPSNVELAGEGANKSVFAPLPVTPTIMVSYEYLLVCKSTLTPTRSLKLRVQNTLEKSHAPAGRNARALCVGGWQLCSHHSEQHLA